MLRQAWRDAGREGEGPEVVPCGVLPSEGKLARYRDLGIAEVALQLPAAGEAEVLRTLDEYAQYL